MSSEPLESFLKESFFKIEQQSVAQELITSFSFNNKYHVLTREGSQVGLIEEVAKGAKSFLSHQFLKSSRPFTMEMKDREGRLIAKLARPSMSVFLSRFEVYDSQGRKLGMIRQRFQILKKKYTLETVGGQIFAIVQCKMLSPWTFTVYTPQERLVGSIRKKWSGLIKESASNYDNYEAQLPVEHSLEQKTMVLLTTVCIDMDHFESKK